jgi:hypothetical protein
MAAVNPKNLPIKYSVLLTGLVMLKNMLFFSISSYTMDEPIKMPIKILKIVMAKMEKSTIILPWLIKLV